MVFFVIDWTGALNVAGVVFLMVFLLLVFLVFVLTLSGRFFIGLEKAKIRQLEKTANAAGPVVELSESDADITIIPGEVLAAISAALNVHYGDIHDMESNIITIVEGDKRYSPWSSKIYGLSAFRRN